MFLLLTTGPADPEAALPFVAAKGAVLDGEDVSIVAMADGVDLLTESTDLHAIEASGLPTVGRTVDTLREAGALADAVALRACCDARDIDDPDLVDWASMDDESAVARVAADHETTLTF
jgi:predicted peroxiredoxin